MSEQAQWWRSFLVPQSSLPQLPLLPGGLQPRSQVGLSGPCRQCGDCRWGAGSGAAARHSRAKAQLPHPQPCTSSPKRHAGPALLPCFPQDPPLAHSSGLGEKAGVRWAAAQHARSLALPQGGDKRGDESCCYKG